MRKSLPTEETFDVDYNGYVTEKILAIGHEMINYRNRLFEPYGVTGKQAMVLGFVVFKCKNNNQITQNDIAKKFCLRASSVNSLLGYLEYRGFIERKVSSEDARAKFVCPSEKSIQIFNKLTACFYSMEKDVIKGFSGEETEQLKNYLTRVYNNVTDL